jgi:hypothetical protein
MIEAATPKFRLGDVVTPIGEPLVKMHVIGVTQYIDRSTGYTCSFWSRPHGAMQRIQMSEAELVLHSATHKERGDN